MYTPGLKNTVNLFNIEAIAHNYSEFSICKSSVPFRFHLRNCMCSYIKLCNSWHIFDIEQLNYFAFIFQLCRKGKWTDLRKEKWCWETKLNARLNLSNNHCRYFFIISSSWANKNYSISGIYNSKEKESNAWYHSFVLHNFNHPLDKIKY